MYTNWKQKVTSPNEALEKRIEGVLDMAVTTTSSLGQAFQGQPVAEMAGIEDGGEGSLC